MSDANPTTEEVATWLADHRWDVVTMGDGDASVVASRECREAIRRVEAYPRLVEALRECAGVAREVIGSSRECEGDRDICERASALLAELGEDDAR